jgi:hypothetical protein
MHGGVEPVIPEYKMNQVGDRSRKQDSSGMHESCQCY